MNSKSHLHLPLLFPLSVAVLFPLAALAANSPPTVTLLSPTNGQQFNPPASIPLSATASDTDGTVSRVEFYDGSTLLISLNFSPYNFTWNNLGVGIYNFMAVAMDNGGARTTSSVAQVTVTTNALGSSAAITSPANGSAFVVGANISIAAQASTPNPPIANVAFYLNNSLFFTDSTAPYGTNVTTLPVGTHRIYAVVTDSLGQTKASATNIFGIVSTFEVAERFITPVGAKASASDSGTQVGNLFHNLMLDHPEMVQHGAPVYDWQSLPLYVP